jgi:hypothetical protein
MEIDPPNMTTPPADPHDSVSASGALIRSALPDEQFVAAIFSELPGISNSARAAVVQRDWVKLSQLFDSIDTLTDELSARLEPDEEDGSSPA